MQLVRRLPCLSLLLTASVALAQPHIFWASDPVRPGETVVVVGEGLAGAKVAVSRYADQAAASLLRQTSPRGGLPATVIQATDQSLKFVVPAGLKPGMFRFDVTTPAGKASADLNWPTVWWSQGEGTMAPAPGGKVRVFGKNLMPVSGKPVVALRPVGGKRGEVFPATGDNFALTATVDAKRCPPGEYELTVSNALGDPNCHSVPVRLRLEKPRPWPQRVLNVRDFGADGQATRDDTEAIRAALEAAAKAGGGVVYFPRGRYQVTTQLDIPRLVTLRGERRDLVAIFWPETDAPPPALLKGTDSFALEDLTLYCSNYNRFVVANALEPDAGNIKLRRVTIRADRYRGHMTPEEADRRLRTPGGNQCPLLTFGGANCEVRDCDLYSSGMVFWLSRLRGAAIVNNDLSNGRWGWYSLSGSDGVIFAGNRIRGGDLMATGGGLNCLDGNTFSQHVYYARNTLSTMYGWDREAMTSDAGGGAYFGKVASARDAVVTLAEDPKFGARDWKGAGLYILDGRGAGQHRRVVSAAGREVTVDAPWQVPPDATSTLTLCNYQGRCLFIGNSFTDAGVALQFYGNALEHICARNTSTRTSGFHNFGMMYDGGIQPNWYVQWLDNEIAEGNVYRSDHDNWRLSGEAHIGVYAMPPRSDWDTPLTLATIVRRNRLANNAHLMLGCEWTGGGFERTGRWVRDALIEGNSITDSDLGIFAYATAFGTVLRGNTFANVKSPLGGPGLSTASVTPAERAAAVRVGLQTLFRDLNLKGDPAKLPGVAGPLASIASPPSPRGRGAGGEGPRAIGSGAGGEGSALQARALLAGLAEIGRQRPDGLPLQTISHLLGLSVVMPWSAPLHNDLQNRPTGGPSRLDLNITAAALPEPLTITADMTVPEGWQTAESLPVQLTGRDAVQLQIPVTVPDQAWAAHTFPVRLNLKLPGGTLRLTTKITAGSGYMRRWMLLGPFPKKTGQPLDATFWPPEDGVDLDAEYDGLTGKTKWTPWENGDWIQFREMYQPAQPAVAYAVACVTAPQAMPAEIRLGASGGAQLFVNGSPIWQTDRQRWAGPSAERVPIQLNAGDNVIMLKLCSHPEEWTVVCEIGPTPTGPPLTGVVVQSPTSFRGRECFRPPVKQATSEGGPLEFTAGVPWKLVYADDFGGPQLGARWRIASGQWKVAGDMVQAAGVAFLAYAERLPAPVRIEYDARAKDAPGDMSAAWLRDPADYRSGTLIGFASNGNTLNKVLVEGQQVAEAPRPLAVAGKWHHVIAQVLADGRVQLYIDGERALDHQAPPAKAPANPCLWSWDSDGMFRRVRIYAG